MSSRATSPRLAWVLNLDAEHELECAHSFTPSLHLRELVRRERRRLIGTLVGPLDIVLDETELRAEHRSAEGCLGIAWSPTRRASNLLRTAGAVMIDTPSVDVLRTVNARPFAARLRAPWAHASFDKQVVVTLDDALEVLARPAPLGWLVRRSFGAAGRGRRRIASGAPDSGELGWLRASLRVGALVVEPWVEVTREFTRSGWVARDGGIVLSAPCVQEVDAFGAWTATSRAESGEVSREDDTRLAETFEHVGRELARAGYFGPFGIDAYRHRTSDGREVLNPLSEINARFTMDWATAMVHDPRTGDTRRALERWLDGVRAGVEQL
ncbi:MAG: hypothetical protein IT454_04240 [Planctomycetes bacterium]|nr:hypothetical protein [Planctomycetota bacterium]